MKKRVWELDAFRGLCVLGMVVMHLLFDIVVLYRLVQWEYPPILTFLSQWGGVLFILISGISATLGSHSVRRGLAVFGCGMVITAVTIAMYLLRIADKSIIIYFGVLQCLGVCMILWGVLKKCPTWLLTVSGVIFAAIGLVLYNVVLVDFPWLMPLGFVYPGFASADYFPILPHLGFFLLGAVIGRTVYGKKRSLFPGADPRNPVIRFLTLVGRASLPVYMLHQPVIAFLVWLLSLTV